MEAEHTLSPPILYRHRRRSTYQLSARCIREELDGTVARSEETVRTPWLGTLKPRHFDTPHPDKVRGLIRKSQADLEEPLGHRWRIIGSDNIGPERTDRVYQAPGQGNGPHGYGRFGGVMMGVTQRR